MIEGQQDMDSLKDFEELAQRLGLEDAEPRVAEAPVVAIVGRPNVGKSALFNRLTQRRIAVVEETPGVTRDRLCANMALYDRTCTLVDTGGLEPSDRSELASKVRLQVKVAVDEAAAIVFVVDSREAPTATDFEIADLLRRSKRPIVLVANKVDGAEAKVEDFYPLRLGESLPVSATQGRNIHLLVDRIHDLVPPIAPLTEEEDPSVRIAVVGRPNVGKSSLTNAVLGQERSIVSATPGTTRDAIDTRCDWNGRPVTLIDTAGLRRKARVKESLEYYCVMRALRAVRRSDVVVMVVDNAGIMTQDAKIAGYCHECGKPAIVAANKIDLLAKSLDDEAIPEERRARYQRLLQDDYVRSVRKALPFFTYAPVLFTCAAQQKGIKALMSKALEVHDSAQTRVTTAELNTVLAKALEDHPPPSRHGKRLRVYYATQVSAKPPTFVLFVNDPELVHFSYQRHLENVLRRRFPFEGAPLRLFFRARKRTDPSEMQLR